MGADTSVVKKKHEWNSMAGEEEWMDKHRKGEGEGDGQWTCPNNRESPAGYQGQSYMQ